MYRMTRRRTHPRLRSRLHRLRVVDYQSKSPHMDLCSGSRMPSVVECITTVVPIGVRSQLPSHLKPQAPRLNCLLLVICVRNDHLSAEPGQEPRPCHQALPINHSPHLHPSSFQQQPHHPVAVLAPSENCPIHSLGPHQNQPHPNPTAYSLFLPDLADPSRQDSHMARYSVQTMPTVPRRVRDRVWAVSSLLPQVQCPTSSKSQRGTVKKRQNNMWIEYHVLYLETKSPVH